jgi:FtsP/CotA-like multicopper oxidase with cupredoxin domain
VQPISRRTALQLGALGMISATGGCGLFGQGQSPSSPSGGAVFREPRVMRSEGGSLEVTLEAGVAVHEVAGRKARTLGYNEGLPGPTLVLRPGDRLRVRLVNRLDEPTNLHVHGLHVSPKDSGDNAFVVVAPGESFDYDYLLPENHPAGVFWYHPHHHGMVADQVYGGLYGAILVEDVQAPAVSRERLLVVSDITLDGSGAVVPPSPMEQVIGREGELVMVNGLVTPILE